jgi:glutaredoxin/glutathione-dependent peroxiredoxin
MTISIGERLPDASFRVPGEDGPSVMTTQDVFSGKRVVLFAVPGAFTPTCTMNHLPGFLEHNEALRAKGVDTIAVVAVNDVHVMKAWRQSTGAGDRIVFLSDGNGEFAKAVGLDADLSAGGLGVRSKRYSMLVEDGVVRQLNVEPSPGQADTSSAETILGQI